MVSLGNYAYAMGQIGKALQTLRTPAKYGTMGFAYRPEDGGGGYYVSYYTDGNEKRNDVLRIFPNWNRPWSIQIDIMDGYGPLDNITIDWDKIADENVIESKVEMLYDAILKSRWWNIYKDNKLVENKRPPFHKIMDELKRLLNARYGPTFFMTYDHFVCYKQQKILKISGDNKSVEITPVVTALATLPTSKQVLFRQESDTTIVLVREVEKLYDEILTLMNISVTKNNAQMQWESINRLITLMQHVIEA